MATYLPPPPGDPTPTRLVLPDGTVLGPGDLPLVEGVGIALRASGDGFALDAPYAGLRRPAFLHIPDLSTFPGVTLQPILADEFDVELLHMQAIILGTTPGASTSADSYGIVVAGSVSGSTELRIIGDVREHAFNGFASQALSAHWRNGDSMGTVGWGKGGIIEPTAAGTVTSVSFDHSNITGSGNRRAFVLDEARTQVLGVSEERIGGNTTAEKNSVTSEDSEGWHDYQMQESFEVEANTRYWVCVASSDGASSGMEILGITAATSLNTFQAATPDLVDARLSIGSAVSADGSELLAGGPANATLDNQYAIRINGQVGAIPLVGDTDISVVTNGVPPATPTEVALRLVYAEAAS